MLEITWNCTRTTHSLTEKHRIGPSTFTAQGLLPGLDPVIPSEGKRGGKDSQGSQEEVDPSRSLPFDVILLCLVGLVRGLDVVPFAHHGDVTLEVALEAGREVLGVGQDGPFVVKLVLCMPGDRRDLCHNQARPTPPRHGLPWSGTCPVGEASQQNPGKSIGKGCLVLKMEKQRDELEGGGVSSPHPGGV